MLAHNTINYMRYVAADLLGHEPEGKLHTPEGAPYPTEWLVRAPGQILALVRHMAGFGYTVTAHDDGWIGVSGHPINVGAVRDLEVRKAQARVEEIREAGSTRIMQMTARF